MRTLTTRGTMTTTMGASQDTDTATTTAKTNNNYYNILKTRAIFANIKTVFAMGRVILCELSQSFQCPTHHEGGLMVACGVDCQECCAV